MLFPKFQFFLLSFLLSTTNIIAQIECGDAYPIPNSETMLNQIVTKGNFVAWTDIWDEIQLYNIEKNEIFTVHEQDMDTYTQGISLTENYLYYSLSNQGISRLKLDDYSVEYLIGTNAYFSVNGTEMVYTDGNSGESNQVYFYSEDAAPLLLSGFCETARHLSIGEDRIYFSCNDGEIGELYLYKISEGLTELVDEYEYTSPINYYPRVLFHENYTFLTKRIDGKAALLRHEVSTNQLDTLLADENTSAFYNDIDANQLSYTYGNEIYIFNISDNSTIVVPQSQNGLNSRFGLNSILWQDFMGNLKNYNFTDETVSQIADGGAEDFIIFTLSNDYLVYTQGTTVEHILVLESNFPLEVQVEQVTNVSGSEANGSINISVGHSLGGLTYSWMG